MKNSFFVVAMLVFVLILAGCWSYSYPSSSYSPVPSSRPTTTVYTQTDVTEADFSVRLTSDNAGAVIIRYNGTATIVRIPTTIQGFPVREIGDVCFMNNKTITSVIIPEGVTIIQGSSVIEMGSARPVGAFMSCEKLSQVTLPSTLRKIGNYAFNDTALHSIIIPEGVTEIGYCAFYYCRTLTSVTLPSTIERIGMFAFASTALNTVTIPDSVQSIVFLSNALNERNNAFAGTSLNLLSQAALRRRGYTYSF
jgi:hypothetical protein